VKLYQAVWIAGKVPILSRWPTELRYMYTACHVQFYYFISLYRPSDPKPLCDSFPSIAVGALIPGKFQLMLIKEDCATSSKKGWSTGSRKSSFVPWPITQIKHTCCRRVSSRTRNRDGRREVSLFPSVGQNSLLLEIKAVTVRCRRQTHFLFAYYEEIGLFNDVVMN
jgi:hypothetical protein